MIKQAGKFQKLTVVFLIALMGMTLVYACGSENDEQFSGNLLQISLNCIDLNETARGSNELGIERSFSDIVILRLTVEDGSPTIVPIVDEFNPDNPFLMIDVPAGSDRRFTIEGLDGDDNLVCFGETITDINVETTDIDISCDLLIENCTDEIDNTFEGLIDCEDPDCFDNEFCIAPGDDDDDVVGDDDDDETPAREDDTPNGCSDEIDNDEDGFIDCFDNDCLRNIDCLETPPLSPPPSACSLIFDGEQGFPDCDDPDCCNEPSCVESEVCFEPEPPNPMPNFETDCSDEVDNDGDEDTDCNDSDCVEDISCCQECYPLFCADPQQN